MRKLFLVGLLGVAVAAFGGGIALDTTRRLEFTNCPAAGGDGGTLHAGSLIAGQYLMRVKDEDVSICFHEYASSAPACPYTLSDGGSAGSSTCWACTDGGGEFFPRGTVMTVSVPNAGLGFSCRSATATGDVAFTHAN